MSSKFDAIQNKYYILLITISYVIRIFKNNIRYLLVINFAIKVYLSLIIKYIQITLTSFEYPFFNNEYTPKNHEHSYLHIR